MKGFLKTFIAFLPVLILLSLGDAPQVFAQDIFWSNPQKIAPVDTSTDFATRPAIATDSKGYVHTVWQQTAAHPVYINPPRSPAGIWYSFWNGDAWSTAQQLNIPVQGFPTKPSIAITPNDNIHVVWAEDTEAEETYDQIWYTRYSGGSWSQPVSISAHQVDYSWEWEPVITADAAGNLYVIYNYSNNNLYGTYLYYTKYTSSTSSWSTPANISQGLTYARNSDLGVDSSGNIHVLIWDSAMGSTGGVFYTYYNGSTWSSLQQLKTGEAIFPRLVVDGANNLHAVWATNFLVNPTTWETHIEYAIKPASGSWSSPYVVSTTVANPWWWIPLSGLAVDLSNNAYVGWGQYNSTWYDDTLDTHGGSYGIDAMYRKRNTDGTWSNPIFVRSTKYLDAPTIWRDKWWNQHFVWSEMNPTNNQWQFWYSEIPANSSAYTSSSALTITMEVTTDTIKIPANALSSNATISAQVGPVPASRDPLVTTIPRSYTFRPHGMTFINGKVATATIKYTDAEVLGANESQLKVYIWDPTLYSGLGGWTGNFTTGVNTNTNRISADLPHFSLYGIMAPKIEAQFQSPLSPYTGSSIPLAYQIIDLATGQPIDPPAERLVLDENDNLVPFWDEYKAILVDNEGTPIETQSYDAGQGSLHYDAANNTYTGNFSGANLSEGDYTIEVYLASTIPLGSQTFHYTPQPSINVTFLPPLKDDTLYALKDGSTLPVKFTLTYENGIPVEAPTLPDDVIVVIRDSNGVEKARYLYGTGDDSVRYDPITNQYIANIHTKEVGLGIGEYKIEVLVKGQAQAQSPTGSTIFKITEPGKVKGVTTP